MPPSSEVDKSRLDVLTGWQYAHYKVACWPVMHPLLWQCGSSKYYITLRLQILEGTNFSEFSE